MGHPEVKRSIVSSCCLHNRHLFSISYFKILFLKFIIIIIIIIIISGSGSSSSGGGTSSSSSSNATSSNSSSSSGSSCCISSSSSSSLMISLLPTRYTYIPLYSQFPTNYQSAVLYLWHKQQLLLQLYTTDVFDFY